MNEGTNEWMNEWMNDGKVTRKTVENIFLARYDRQTVQAYVNKKEEEEKTISHQTLAIFLCLHCENSWKKKKHGKKKITNKENSNKHKMENIYSTRKNNNNINNNNLIM